MCIFKLIFFMRNSARKWRDKRQKLLSFIQFNQFCILLVYFSIHCYCVHLSLYEQRKAENSMSLFITRRRSKICIRIGSTSTSTTKIDVRIDFMLCRNCSTIFNVVLNVYIMLHNRIMFFISKIWWTIRHAHCTVMMHL